HKIFSRDWSTDVCSSDHNKFCGKRSTRKVMENKYQTTQVKTVKIFKTTVRNDKEAAKTAASLLTLYPVYKINFDLEDKDNILRKIGRASCRESELICNIS